MDPTIFKYSNKTMVVSFNFFKIIIENLFKKFKKYYFIMLFLYIFSDFYDKKTRRSNRVFWFLTNQYHEHQKFREKRNEKERKNTINYRIKDNCSLKGLTQLKT